MGITISQADLDKMLSAGALEPQREDPVKKVARLKAEATLNPAPQTLEAERLKSEKERLANQASILDSKSKIKDATTRPVAGVKGEKLGIIEDTGDKIEDLSFRTELTKPQQTALNTYQDMANTSADTLGIIAKAETRPDVFSKDFNVITKRLTAANDFKSLRDQKLTQAIQQLSPEDRANPYLQQIIAAKIDSLAAGIISKREGEDIDQLINERNFLMDGEETIQRYQRPQPQQVGPQPTPVVTQPEPMYSDAPPLDATLGADEGMSILQEIRRLSGANEFAMHVRDFGQELGAADSLTESRSKKVGVKEQAINVLYDQLKSNFSADEIEAMSRSILAGPPKRTTGSTWRAQS
jgi:hypothetical protein